MKLFRSACFISIVFVEHMNTEESNKQANKLFIFVNIYKVSHQFLMYIQINDSSCKWDNVI